MHHPNRVALDAEGTFHIGGARRRRDPQAGRDVHRQLGREGRCAPGQFVAGSVHGAWMDTEGSLYTAEAGVNNRLQKFRRV